MLIPRKDPLNDVFNKLGSTPDKELKMCDTVKVIVAEETEGCWGSPKAESKCRACGAIQIEVPRDNHANSAFWVNEQPDGLILKCCPDGCTEKDAADCMSEYLDYRQFKKGDSWSWSWDYTKIQYGWITPDCRLLICDHMGHLGALYDDDNNIDTHYEAEQKGYIKFTGQYEIEFSWGKKPNKRQAKIIRDCMTDRNRPMDESSEHKLEHKNGVLNSSRLKQ